ncbi:MAG: hypothetical protein GXY82_03555 [Methanospirillum sp.]|nr:hypothetical protein [Methanospirillum sp.]
MYTSTVPARFIKGAVPHAARPGQLPVALPDPGAARLIPAGVNLVPWTW